MMTITEIQDANFGLVELKSTNSCEPTPHCKKHGAMNKIAKDGFWRCITVSGFKRIINGNSVAEKHIETVCRAGCYELN